MFIAAVSVPVPGSMHDKKRCNQLQTLERLPTGCKVGADKGYQGLATDPVSTISTLDSETGETLHRLDKKLDDSCYTISLFSFYNYGLVMQTICGLVKQQTLRRHMAAGKSAYCA